MFRNSGIAEMAYRYRVGPSYAHVYANNLRKKVGRRSVGSPDEIEDERRRRGLLVSNDTAMLRGARVLIVGGSGAGIGRIITRTVARSGAYGVAVVGSSVERTAATISEIENLATRAVALPGDVRRVEVAQRSVKTAVAELGGLDVLITVVGGTSSHGAPAARVHETSDEVWAAMLDINIGYVFRFVRSALEVFVNQGTGGSIVSVGSINGVRSSPQAVAYGVAKAGLINLARTVSVEYGPDRVRMNVINCGPIGSTRLDGLIAEGKFSSAPIPMGRPALAQEVADAVVYLASPISQFASGVSFDLDGGMLARNPLEVQSHPSDG